MPWAGAVIAGVSAAAAVAGTAYAIVSGEDAKSEAKKRYREQVKIQTDAINAEAAASVEAQKRDALKELLRTAAQGQAGADAPPTSAPDDDKIKMLLPLGLAAAGIYLLSKK